MVRGPMIVEVTAGCAAANATARCVSDMPASAATLISSSTSSSLRALPGSGRVEPAGQPPGPAVGHVDVGVLAVLAGQPAAGQRAPGDHAHAVPGAGGQHVGLDRRGRRSSTAAARCGTARARAVRRPTGPRRSARPGTWTCRGPDLALADEVGQRRQGLVDVGRGVGPVHLVQVDVVGRQPPQAVLHLADDPAARVAAHGSRLHPCCRGPWSPAPRRRGAPAGPYRRSPRTRPGSTRRRCR